MNWRVLVLLVLAAVFSFGGSFTCRTGDDPNDDVKITTP